MKKHGLILKRILALILSGMILSGVFPAKPVSAGGLDDEIDFTLMHGVLTIKGSGIMPDYNPYGAPWDRFKNDYEKVVIEPGIVNIGENAFYGAGMKEIEFPASVIEVGKHAIYDCPNLEKLSISSAMNDIEFELNQEAFGFLPSLKEISVDSGNRNFWSDGRALYSKDKSTLYLYAAGNEESTYIVPAETRELHCHSFVDSKNLTDLAVLSTAYMTYAQTGTFNNSGVKRIYCAAATHLYQEQLKNSQTIEWKPPSDFIGSGDLSKIDVEMQYIDWDTLMTYDAAAYEYDGTAHKPDVRLQWGTFFVLREDRDFKLVYKNNVNTGTATVTAKGMGTYTGEKSLTFSVFPKSITTAKVTKIKTKTYTGSKIKQSPKVVVNSKKLKSGRDYKISYKKNKACGIASMTITGKGNYKDSLNFTFKIKVLAVLVLSEGSEGESDPSLSPSFWWFAGHLCKNITLIPASVCR